YALQRLVTDVSFFFFQAEDGIRVGHVTGVQTCALPIYLRAHRAPRPRPSARARRRALTRRDPRRASHSRAPFSIAERRDRIRREIGRASCREKGKSRWPTDV